MLDVVQQLNIDVFCPLIYNRAKQAESQEEFRRLMEKEITEEGLQWINDAARVDGFQPISFSGKQKEKTMRRKKREKSNMYHIKRAIKKYGIPKKLKMF